MADVWSGAILFRYVNRTIVAMINATGSNISKPDTLYSIMLSIKFIRTTPLLLVTARIPITPSSSG